MSSPITLSGFNSIDFNTILNAVMQQESQPLTALQTQQQTLQQNGATYGVLATKLDALQSAASDLATPSAASQYAVTSSDTTLATASVASESAAAGRYEVVVNQLARAQVTVSTSSAPDIDSTVVATGGTLTLGGATVSVSGPVTLHQLATAINDTAGTGVTASIVQTSPGAYRLVLTSDSTGLTNAFTVRNDLTGSALGFADTNGDGLSGNSAGDNAVQASDASVTVNNLTITSSTNTLDSAIPGVSLSLVRQDPSKTVVISVQSDDSGLTDKVKAFVSAYNDLAKFADGQRTAAGQGSNSIARDGVLRGVQSALRSSLLTASGSGAYTSLAAVGIGFTRTGQLSLDQSALDAAVAADPSAVSALFTGTGGAFSRVSTVLAEYTRAGGFVPGAQTRITDSLTRLANRITGMQARLALRRAALQREYTAADGAMSSLKAQSASISGFSSQLSGTTL